MCYCTNPPAQLAAVLLILSDLAVIFSSQCFLYFPTGYQGGRSPASRNTGWSAWRVSLFDIQK